jgi:hypothetical protein
VIVDQLALFPGSYYALKLGLEIALCLGVRQLACKRAVEVIYGAEVVTVLARDDGELIVGMSRVWVQFSGKTIVSLCRTPVAFLVLLDELRFAIAGEITEVNQRLVARLENLVVQQRRDALARRCLGSCYLVSIGYAVKLSVEVQYILAVEALAGLDEVEIILLEFSKFHDTVLGALELPCISIALPVAFSVYDAQSYAPA